MKNKMKGQQNIRRPLPIRLIALVMAVVMVFSVVTINNYRGRVEAEGGTKINNDTVISITNLTAAGIDPTAPDDTKVYDVYVPYDSGLDNKFIFELPSYSTYNPADTTITLYSTSDGKYYKTNPGEGSTEIADAKVSVSHEWVKLVNNKEETVQDITNGETTSTVYLKKITRYEIPIDETSWQTVTVEDGDSPVLIGTVNVNKEDLCAIKTGQSASGITAEEDNTAGGTKNEYARGAQGVNENYVGAVSYEVYKGDALDGGPYSKLEDVVSAYSGEEKADGTYSLVKKITYGTGESAVVLNQNTTPFTKNNMLINSISYTYNGNSTPVVIDSNIGDFTIDTINAKNDINITIDTDADFTNGYSYEISGDDGIPAEGNVSISGSNNDDIIISIDSSEIDSKMSYDFTLSIKHGSDVVKSIKVTLICTDGVPHFYYSDTTPEYRIVNSDGSEPLKKEGKLYFNTTNAKIVGLAQTLNNSGAYISSVAAYKKGAEGYPSTTDYKTQYAGDRNDQIFEVGVGLSEGSNTFKAEAESTFGDKSDFEHALEVVAYLDTTAPSVTNVSLKQTVEGGTVYSENSLTNSSNTYTATQKVSKGRTGYEPVITIALEDNTDGCGLPASGAVVFGETALTKNGDGTYSFKVPAADEDGTFTFTVKDALGNSKPITVNLLYFDESMTITGPKIYSGSGDNITEFSINSDSFVTWTADAVGKITTDGYYFSYTVSSKEVPISSATIEYNGGAPSAIPAANIKKTSSTDSEPPYTYTITTAPYVETTNNEKKHIILTVTNANGDYDTNELELLKVDVTAPGFGTPEEKDRAEEGAGPAITDGTWYKKELVLWFTSSDGTTDLDSGISSVEKNYTAEEKDGISSMSALSTTTGSFTVTVKESTEKDASDAYIPSAVKLKLTDVAGNESTYSQSFLVDGAKPVTSIKINGGTSSVSGMVYPTSFTSIEFGATDEQSGIDDSKTKVYVGNDTTGMSIATANSTPLATLIGEEPQENKAYSFTLVATDKVGNEYTDSLTVIVDSIDPEAKAEIISTEPKTSGFFKDAVKVKLTVTDSNIETVTVTDGSKTYSPSWEGDSTYTATIDVTGDTSHQVVLTVIDKGSKSVTAKTPVFTIDTAEPDVTTLLNGSEYKASNSYNKTVTTGISYTDANKDDNDITATIVRDIPGGGQTTSTKKGLGPHSISEDGKYTVTYKVVDKAGNSTTTDPIGFTVDNTAPVHNLYVTTANPSKVEDYPNNYINGVGKWQSSHEAYRYGQFYNGDVTVELNYFDYNLDWVYVTDNGEEISPSWTKNGAFGKATYTFTSEGYHDVQIWSKDLSGNETNDTVLGKRVRFTIDRSAPSITTYLNSSLYSEGSGTRYLNTNGSLNVSVSEGNKDTYDLTRSYKVTPPGGSSKTYEDKVDEGTENYSEEADYEVSYVAVDKAGNKSATRNVYFRVDRTAPKLTINGPGSSSNASSTSVSFNVQESFYWDMTSCTVKIYKKVDGSGEVLEKTLDMNPSSANYSQSYSFVDDAEYRMEFTAEDKCGNKSQTDYTFIKDGNAPSILLSGVKNYDKTDKNVELTITIEEAFYTSNRVTLSGTRTDIDGKSHKIDFDDFATNRTKISQLQQMFKEDGIYDITVTSTDKAGNSSSKTVHFTIDTTKPVIGDLSKYDGVKLNKFKWDVDLDELVKDLTVCDIKLYLDGALYDGTSDIEDGSHVLKVEATDELGHSSSKEVTFVLDSKAPNIIVMNVEEGDNLLESTDITVTVELDEDSLDTVTLNDKAIDIANNEGKITVNTKGDYVLNATAHDEAGNVSSVEIKFSYGKQTNLLFIGIIAGAAILLLLLLLVFLRRRRNDN